MYRIVSCVLAPLSLTLALAACAGSPERSDSCALSPTASYTITTSEGSPACADDDCHTAVSLLGDCATRWAPACAAETLTYTCGDTTIDFTLIDVVGSTYTVRMSNPAIANSAQTLHFVEI